MTHDDLEERLRRAYRAQAEQLERVTIPAEPPVDFTVLPGVLDTPARSWRRIAAVAVVAAMAVGGVVLVQQRWTIGPAGPAAPGTATSAAVSNPGVGSTNPPVTNTGEPALGPIPSAQQMQDRVVFPLPLDAYQPTPMQSLLFDRAVWKVEASCLTRFGFHPTNPVEYVPTGQAAQPGYDPTLFGINVQAQVDQYGYHPPPDPVEAKHEQANTWAAQYPQVMWDIDNGTLTGDYKGVPVPSGGCLGEANRTVYGEYYKPSGVTYPAIPAPGKSPDTAFVKPAIDLPATQANLLANDAYNRTLKDSRMVAAFAQWSSCMAGRGYSYKTPLDANDAAWPGDKATAQEIATAQADLSCRRAQNLVGEWYAVDTAYQDRAVQQNAALLGQANTADDALVQRATRLMGQ